MTERERRKAICMWALGFATALLVDGILFDGRSWINWPIVIALLAMAAYTMRHDNHRK
jgi:hypothetical protein